MHQPRGGAIEMNTCDKCKEKVHELDLIWLTAEDFQPLPDERVIPEKAKGLDAVCHNCYGDIITTEEL